MSIPQTQLQPKSQRTTSVEAYHAVLKLHHEGALNTEQWRTYEILWHNGPITKKDFAVYFQQYHGNLPTFRTISKNLRWLMKRELVETVKGGRFDTTDKKELLVLPPPAKRPNKKKFAKGVEELELLYISASAKGMITSDEAQGVIDWLKSKLT